MIFRSKNTEGAAYMTLAMAAFSCGDALSKSLITHINTGEILLLRGVVTSLLIFALAKYKGALRSWRMILQPMVAARVFFEILAALTYITALGLIPLSNASAILQSIPLVVTLAAAVFLREPVGWRRWSAIIVGLLGVLIIIRPGADGFTQASLLCVASVLVTAGRDLCTRRIDPQIPTLMITLVTAIAVSGAGAALVVPMGGWNPLEPVMMVELVLASTTVMIGYLSVIHAMRMGDISFIAPFRYTNLIFSALLGIIFFAERPDHWTLIGAAIVILSGLYSFYREKKRLRMLLESKREPVASPGTLT